MNWFPILGLLDLMISGDYGYDHGTITITITITITMGPTITITLMTRESRDGLSN